MKITASSRLMRMMAKTDGRITILPVHQRHQRPKWLISLGLDAISVIAITLIGRAVMGIHLLAVDAYPRGGQVVETMMVAGQG